MAVLDFPSDTSQSPYELNGITYNWDGQKWVAAGTGGGGSGGDLTLQEVTDNGNTTTNSATFGGNVQAGGNPNSAIATGTQMTTTAGYWASAGVGTTSVFRGYTTGSDVITSRINANGSATFAGTINSPDYNSNSATGKGFYIDPSGLIIGQKESDKGTQAIWQGRLGSDLTSTIKADGSSEFASHVSSAGRIVARPADLSSETKIYPEGLVKATRPTGTSAQTIVFQGGTNDAQQTSRIFADGSAQFGEDEIILSADGTIKGNNLSDGLTTKTMTEILSAGGGDLQSVTDAGNTTTNTIKVQGDGDTRYVQLASSGTVYARGAATGSALIVQNDTDGSSAINFQGNGQASFMDGNVQFVGAATPKLQLTTASTTGWTGIETRQNDDTLHFGLYTYDSGNAAIDANTVQLWNYKDADMIFATNNTARMTIKNDGKIEGPNGNMNIQPTGTINVYACQAKNLVDPGSGSPENVVNLWYAQNYAGDVTSYIHADGSAMFAQGARLGGDAAANHLSDYEEGFWSPGVEGGSPVIAFNYGRYIKIGHLVWVNGSITVNNLNGGDPGRVTGLPFVASTGSGTDGPGYGSMGESAYGTEYMNIVPFVDVGEQFIRFTGCEPGEDSMTRKTDILNRPTGSSCRFTVVYQTNE